ncbi:hypothetical protein KJA13_02540 [Patescibacteria group bacterium]|nr:hypothetical protein [Patescibacteria group bacterium]
MMLKNLPKRDKTKEKYTTTDIIKRSQKLSGDWLTKDIKKRFPQVEEKKKIEKKEEKED